MLRHINRPEMLRPASSPLSHVVIDGTYAFVAGIAAGDIQGGDKVIGDVGAETEIVMNKIKEILADVGVGMERIVRVDVHLADLREIRAMNAVYGRYFKEGAYPARTCTESARIVGNARVEITCMARI